MAALSEIQKLEARYAENPDGRFFAPLADAYRKAGDLDRALELISGNLAKHPDYLSAHIVQGRCYLDKKDDAGASASFNRVLELDGENIIALKSLSEIAERTGDTLSARRWLQRLLTIDAMNTEAADDLARLGGPLAEEAAEGAAEVAAAPDLRVSFADIAIPEPAGPEPAAAPTLAAPAIDMPLVPRTLERPAVKWTPPPEPAPEPVAAPPAEPMPVLELEPTSFQPPPAEQALPAADVVPFDDALAWGAGERQSSAVHAEDIAEAAAHHEAVAPAIDFLATTPASSAPLDPPPHHEPVPPTPWADPNMSTLPMDSVPAPPDWSAPEPAPMAAAADQTPTIEMPPVVVPSPVPAPEPVAEMPPAEVVAAAYERSSGDLKLIMPEDVTPAEEMRRPSSKQIHMVSPEVGSPAADAPAEPLVTETMGDLYLRQGLKDQAADVYRRVLAQRPDDAGVRAKLAAIESPPSMSASAQGSEAVGSWLRRIANAQLPGAAAAPAPAAPEAGPTPMEQAFAPPEGEPDLPAPTPVPVAAEVPGSPARPATDQFSLDNLFGAGQSASAATPAPAPAPHTLGSSFDEFFGSSPKPETVRPSKESAPGARQSEDDLSAFNAWLHGLKR